MTKIRIITALYLAFLGTSAYVFSKPEPRAMLNFMSVIPHWDKLAHFCLSGMLAMLLNLSMDCRHFHIWRIRIFYGTLIVAFMATAEEFSQTWIPGRVFDPWDVLSDVAGAVVFGRIGLYLYNRRTLPRLKAAVLRHWGRAGEPETPTP